MRSYANHCAPDLIRGPSPDHATYRNGGRWTPACAGVHAEGEGK